jgi:hypothetical protein
MIMNNYNEISNLNAKFAYLIDHCEGVGVAELFVKDGSYRIGNQVSADGREMIRGFYEMRKARGNRTSRHVFSPPVFLEDPTNDSASAVCILTLFAGDGDGPFPADIHLVADYHDEYEKQDGIWFFKSRTFVPKFGEVPSLGQ